MRLLLIGTDTDVGKTWITAGLTTALRARGHRVWLHKPVACGEWDGTGAADGRSLRLLAGDGQEAATICPREYPEACSPHLAAAAAGHALDLADLAAMTQALAAACPGDLLLETAGGLLAPLDAVRRTNRDLARALCTADPAWRVLLVTRPHLGTLNHTALTAEAARDLPVVGLVVNHHQPLPPSLAVTSAARELAAITSLPVLAEVAFGAPPSAWAGPLLDRLATAP